MPLPLIIAALGIRKGLKAKEERLEQERLERERKERASKRRKLILIAVSAVIVASLAVFFILRIL
jgi:hypothetical protein